ncbi:type VI secretion system ATPase TssH [Vibrio sp. JC009]|uniref:type VI secretion system ATPase TssH n=1 Tax=Vibrio sp. JC009 TaxID=2912314 RepID=UPI0023AE9855|nr:type VI secretion system ATPase TssH [Vibrio sp. JC009]WED24549.1 type VI secretion system ATPase TssH [Vibrio sp. JC009]
MIRIELPMLISKLNEQSKLALESAATLCVELQHPEVTPVHYLRTLLDNPLCDVSVILRQADMATEPVLQAITNSYTAEKLSESYPAFSPHLVELLQEAWLLSTTELVQTELRSGAIFLAALLREDRYFTKELAHLFSQLNREHLQKSFEQMLLGSSESKNNDLTHSAHECSYSVSDSSLKKYCSNVTEDARKGGIDPVLCREKELNLMSDILCRRRKNNPIVVGEAGVGKSAMIEGLALRIINNQVPDKLKGTEVLSLDLGLLQAGASVKGEFEKRLKSVVEEVKCATKPTILFIDEAHTLIGSGNQEGGSDAANLLKPALARGEISVVAATTWKEYKKYFEKDPALSRRFQVVKLEEPGIEETTDILRGLTSAYETSHQVLITDEAVKAAAELSARYISGRQLPDKAIDVLDTACARISINFSTPPNQLALLDTEQHKRQLEMTMLERTRNLGTAIDEEYYSTLNTQMQQAEKEREEIYCDWQSQKQVADSVIRLRGELIKMMQDEEYSEESANGIRDQLQQLYSEMEDIPPHLRLIHPEVDAGQVAEVIADWTGVPMDQMNSDELLRVTNMTSILSQEVKGQKMALQCIHRHLLTARADLRRAGRPNGSLLLVGPSGVGKTETVIQLAGLIYGGRQFLTTINMSEYQEKHTVSRLIGSPPGYVGYGEGGVLTEAIRKTPYSIVLLDEVEKAHPEVLNIFYQAFDKGELADGEGRIIDCKNIVFFMTSNLGTQTIFDNQEFPDELQDRLYQELSEFFKPALLARMEVVPYLPLSKEVMAGIVEAKLKKLKSLLIKRYGARVEISDELTGEIISRANQCQNGARMLESIIEGHLLPPISLAILEKLAHKQAVNAIRMSVENGQFIGEVE